MSQHDTLTLREALRSIQYEAASLADAQVIALQALNATYPARAALSATQPAQAAQSADERAMLEMIDERDRCHEWADQLASAIAKHTCHEIGEHTSANNPWRMALNALECHERQDTTHEAGARIKDLEDQAAQGEPGYFRREIGEDSDWRRCTHEQYLAAQDDPHIDTRVDERGSEVDSVALMQEIGHWRAQVQSLQAQLEKAADALGYATRLASALWEHYWKSDAPNWAPCDNLMGVLSQIDNMTSGMDRKPPALAQGAGEVSPYAYAVYFPDQPTEMLAHDLDDLCEDMTNREHTVTPLYTQPAAGADVRDAQRYRWLRAQDNEDFAFAVVKNPHFDVYESPEELDAAIDAAIAASGRKS